MKRSPTSGKPSPKGPSQRQLRAGELVRHALVDVFREEDIADPDLAGVAVTVSVSLGEDAQPGEQAMTE